MPYGDKKNYSESNVNYFPNTYRDFNETSPGMMLIEMSAYVGDVLSFYIDNQYKEMMLPLVEERRNAVNIANMLGYKVKPIVPAYVDLTFTQDVPVQTGEPENINYSQGGVFDKGIKVTSTSNSDIEFQTLDVLDFSVTGSVGDYNYIHSDKDKVAVTGTDGLATSYTLSRKVRAVSGETKTKTFTVQAPQKFLRLTLPELNVIDIISCIDTNNNKWYEVDYLAQDFVPIETHYSEDLDRDSAYFDVQTNEVNYDSPVPYSLTYLKTNKKFTLEVNSDNTTSLVFGNGILKDVTDISSVVLDLEQAGITIPGQTTDLNDFISQELGQDDSTLGEAPNQTTMTITYRVGGGISSNVPVGDLTTHDSPTPTSGLSTLTVTNNTPARGGKDQETIEEIREKSKAFFTTQNRCVTKADW